MPDLFLSFQPALIEDRFKSTIVLQDRTRSRESQCRPGESDRRQFDTALRVW